MKDRDSFYKKLKTQLDETTKFPTDYLYKFIVSAEGNKVEQVQRIFDNKGAVIRTKKSKTGKYISVSIVMKIGSSDQVIAYYQQAEKIEGIISL
jgi:putative lipoic acid-binding regulatory protein